MKFRSHFPSRNLNAILFMRKSHLACAQGFKSSAAFSIFSQKPFFRYFPRLFLPNFFFPTQNESQDANWFGECDRRRAIRLSGEGTFFVFEKRHPEDMVRFTGEMIES